MMYSKLLVTLDGSRIAEGILPYARSLAKTFNVPVELLPTPGHPAEAFWCGRRLPGLGKGH